MGPDSNRRRPRTQDGVVIGNVEDKSSLDNPISRHLVGRFDHALFDLVATVGPTSVHEVGCGEGRLARQLAQRLRVAIRATDFSRQLIREARADPAKDVNFAVRSIYDLAPDEDAADLVICCEVLEHVEDPHRAVEALRRLGSRSYILSVPREPIWRVLNLCRGKYVGNLGNTPGHLNHWSQRGFVHFLEDRDFRVRRLRAPLPWTMVEGAFDGGESPVSPR